jgi:hypothetical protein
MVFSLLWLQSLGGTAPFTKRKGDSSVWNMQIYDGTRPQPEEPVTEKTRSILEPRTAADSSPTPKRLKLWGKVTVPVHQGRFQVWRM